MPTVKSGRYQAAYSVHPPDYVDVHGLFLPLNNYRQDDCYCCGYVATLTVVRYFDLPVGDPAVLEAVKSRYRSSGIGTTQKDLLLGLVTLGIAARYRDDLDVAALRTYVSIGVPVIITVWPDGWKRDHWVVVRGFGEGMVYLTNHYNMSVEDFEYEWIEAWEDGDTGAGIICTKGR